MRGLSSVAEAVGSRRMTAYSGMAGLAATGMMASSWTYGA